MCVKSEISKRVSTALLGDHIYLKKSKWIFWCKVSCDPDITNYEKSLQYSNELTNELFPYVESALYTRRKAVSVRRSIIHAIWLILDNPIWIFTWWGSNFMRWRIYDICRTTCWKYFAKHFYKKVTKSRQFHVLHGQVYTPSCQTKREPALLNF